MRLGAPQRDAEGRYELSLLAHSGEDEPPDLSPIPARSKHPGYMGLKRLMSGNAPSPRIAFRTASSRDAEMRRFHEGSSPFNDSAVLIKDYKRLTVSAIGSITWGKKDGLVGRVLELTKQVTVFDGPTQGRSGSSGGKLAWITPYD